LGFIWICDVIESDGFIEEESSFKEEEIIDLAEISRID